MKRAIQTRAEEGTRGSVGGRERSASGVMRACLLAAGLILVGVPGSAAAAVWTDQPSYAPGSTVTISGDNSDGAGYAPGEEVSVAVSGPSGYAVSCRATAGVAGAWSCQVILPSDASAIGTYSYTATGRTLGVSQSGSFSDSGCPSSSSLKSHKNVDSSLSASYTTSGGIATYSFKSSNESPTGGVPGLIEYCVYTSPLPDSKAALYSDWTTDEGGGFFDFERTGGNPDNVPFDGTTQTIGTATWNSGKVAAPQTILLHINDTAECTSLEGKTTETCFVRPGNSVCTGTETVVGVGHYGPRAPAGENLDNNLNTCLVGYKEELVYTWENAEKHLALRHLNSASCVKTATEQKFTGQGTAAVNKEQGYEISFTFTIKGGKTYFVMVLEKGGVVVHQFIDEPLTVSHEVISC